MTVKAEIIDSHIHLDMIGRNHPERMQWLKDASCSIVSWSYFEDVNSVQKLRSALAAKAEFIKRTFALGLECYYLAGVHPRCITPDLRPEDIPSLLKPCMDDPLCLGLGEIGLEAGDAREKEIFIAQMEFGREAVRYGKVAGVHTPRSNKVQMTGTILEILSGYKDIASLIVVDHCTQETISMVLDAGFWAGVSLSPIKTSVEELKQIVQMHPYGIDRIMCNTDSAVSFYEDIVQCSQSKDLSESVRHKIFYGNAVSFYNI